MKSQPDSAKRRRRGALEFRLMSMCLVLVIFGVWLAVQLPSRTSAMAEKSKNDVDFKEFADLFAEIYNKVDENYVDPVDNKKLFEGAINGMMSVLDPYSSWLPPVAQDQLTKDTEGEYSGVGLNITLDERRILTVLLPIAGSPSAAAGIAPWDRIIEIEGKSTDGITLTDAVTKLTGPEGSEVKIKVWRPGPPTQVLAFTLKRQQIKVESVFHKIYDDGIGYIRIVKFQDDTANGVRDALEDLKKKNMRGLVVDVRDDPGGLLERAQEICSMFLDKGKLIVSIKGRTARDNREYRSLSDPICTVPMIVLVNNLSASASEIFSGAMQDNHRAVIIGPKGETTYGKASVQTISELKHSLDKDADGNYKSSGLRLTTAHYYTPSGALIMDKGIKPDIGIELPAGQEQALRERGMLGDPSRLKPEGEDGATTDTTSAAPGAPAPAPDAKAPAAGDGDSSPTVPNSTRRLIQMLEKPADAPAKPAFHDIQLDEGIKYLRAILIFQQRKAA